MFMFKKKKRKNVRRSSKKETTKQVFETAHPNNVSIVIL